MSEHAPWTQGVDVHFTTGKYTLIIFKTWFHKKKFNAESIQTNKLFTLIFLKIKTNCYILRRFSQNGTEIEKTIYTD